MSMGKKKAMMASFSKPAWPWPSCKQLPRTSSFRAGQDPVQKVAVSSADSDPTPDSVQSPFSCFTNSSECPSFSGESVESSADSAVLGGLRSDRLFFEPKGVSKSMVEEGEVLEDEPYKNGSSSCVAMAMESDDPYKDFKYSMEEMVQTHELKEWESLEELLLWYLRMNGKEMQRYIVGAFVDVLVDIVASNLETSSSDQDSSVSDSSFDHQEEEDSKFLER